MYDGLAQAAEPETVQVRTRDASRSALRYLGAMPLPTISGTQVKFGPNVAVGFNPVDRKLYLLGGRCWQPYSSSEAGCNVLWGFDAASGRLVAEYPYDGPKGEVQPSHPDGVSLIYDADRNGMAMLPGKTG